MPTEAEVNSEHQQDRDPPLRVGGRRLDAVQAPKPKLSHARRAHSVRMDRYGSACKRPSRAQRHPLGPPVTCFTPWGRAGVTDRIMDALAASRDAAVQMIDTSVVRVHHRSTYLGEQSRYGSLARRPHEQRFTRWWTAMACPSISRSRPVRRITIGSVRFSLEPCSH